MSKFELTEAEMTKSAALSASLVLQITQLLSSGVDTRIIMHTLSVGLMGVVCQEYDTMIDGAPEVTNALVDHAIKLVQTHTRTSVPKPSSN